MKELQVLVAAMDQTDMSLYKEMNISCDAVIANQHDRYSVDIEKTAFGEIKMVTTPTRGVGVNRNLAILYSDAEILLFADDDMHYYDGALEGVIKAFKDIPDADVIIFGIEYSKQGEVFRKKHLKRRRLRIWNALNYGACVTAVRRSSLIRANVSFNRSFGGGCIYGSGEDSLFISDCIHRGLHIYSHELVLGVCGRDSSSWFTGYTEKYFFDKGALWGNIFPVMKPVMIPIFALKAAKLSDLGYFKVLRLMRKGAKASKMLLTYDDVFNK